MKSKISHHFSLLIVSLTVIFLSCSAGKNEDVKSNTFPMIGYFSYMADAAIFIDCRNGNRYPVALEGDYISLEKKYLSIMNEPNEKILVRISGRIEKRLSMEGDREKDFLIVDSLDQFYTDKNCSDFISVASIKNTYWKLVALAGDSIKFVFDREVHLVMENESEKIRGFSGCNNFFGKYEIKESSITIKNLASTKKLCQDIADFEFRFLDRLTSSTRYEIWGESLTLFAKNKVLAKFESVYFN